MSLNYCPKCKQKACCWYRDEEIHGDEDWWECKRTCGGCGLHVSDTRFEQLKGNDMITKNLNIDHQGFYRSTDKEIYKKIKKVRYYAHLERIQQSRYNKWARKLPHNRVKWVYKGKYKSLLTNDGVIMTIWESVQWEKPLLCPVSLSLLWDAYHNACKKYNNPEEIVPFKIDVKALDDILSGLNEWEKQVALRN